MTKAPQLLKYREDPANRELMKRLSAEKRQAAKDVPSLVRNCGHSWPEKQRVKIERRLIEMPESHRNTFIEAMKGSSLRAAVDANCAMCVGWQRIEVTLCTDPACPLWPYRPYQDLKTGGDTPFVD